MNRDLKLGNLFKYSSFLGLFRDSLESSLGNSLSDSLNNSLWDSLDSNLLNDPLRASFYNSFCLSDLIIEDE